MREPKPKEAVRNPRSLKIRPRSSALWSGNHNEPVEAGNGADLSYGFRVQNQRDGEGLWGSTLRVFFRDSRRFSCQLFLSFGVELANARKAPLFGGAEKPKGFSCRKKNLTKRKKLKRKALTEKKNKKKSCENPPRFCPACKYPRS